MSDDIKIEVLCGVDWPIVVGWYAARGVANFSIEELPEETTYLARLNGEPAACVSMQAPCFGAGYLEALVSNPQIAEGDLERIYPALLAYCENEAKELGAKRMFCMSPHEKLTEKYIRLGFKPSAGVVTMLKELH